MEKIINKHKNLKKAKELQDFLFFNNITDLKSVFQVY